MGCFLAQRDQSHCAKKHPIYILSMNRVIIGTFNGLSPLLWEAIIYTNDDLVTSAKFELRYEDFYSRKYIWKCCLLYDNHFVSASMCWKFSVTCVWSLSFSYWNQYFSFGVWRTNNIVSNYEMVNFRSSYPNQSMCFSPWWIWKCTQIIKFCNNVL